jgi:hypothetical protein
MFENLNQDESRRRLRSSSNRGSTRPGDSVLTRQCGYVRALTHRDGGGGGGGGG